jgi:hypothetical protein
MLPSVLEIQRSDFRIRWKFSLKKIKFKNSKLRPKGSLLKSKTKQTLLYYRYIRTSHTSPKSHSWTQNRYLLGTRLTWEKLSKNVPNIAHQCQALVWKDTKTRLIYMFESLYSTPTSWWGSKYKTQQHTLLRKLVPWNCTHMSFRIACTWGEHSSNWKVQLKTAFSWLSLSLSLHAKANTKSLPK